jgi:hypothetical protein
MALVWSQPKMLHIFQGRQCYDTQHQIHTSDVAHTSPVRPSVRHIGVTTHCRKLKRTGSTVFWL